MLVKAVPGIVSLCSKTVRLFYKPNRIGEGEMGV